MKKAFTMIELIFVLVVIGILVAVILPSTRRNPLQEAAVQLLSHIRYTQHLALMDDKYADDSSGAMWYKKRWQLKFAKGVDTESKWSYVVFSDTSGSGNPDADEVAVNPLDRTKKLTGGSTGDSMIHTGDKEATLKMNIGKAYDVQDVDFSSECRTGSTSKNVLFDSLGRPLRGNDRDYISSYDSTTSTNILINNRCTITICSVGDCNSASNDEKVVIAIEPETGYTHILINSI